MVADLHVRSTSDEQGFQQLQPAWNALADEVSPTSVFHRHEWFESAWQWCRLTGRLLILCVYREQDLVAILPMIRERGRRLGLNIRHLRFLGVPDSQHCDLLARPADATDAAAALASWLTAGHDEWDVMYLDKLDSSSNVRQFLLPALAEKKLQGIEAPESRNPGIPLDGNWGDYYSGRTRRLKTGNNNIANKLKRAASTIDVAWTRDGDIDEAQALQHALDISARSWKSDTGLTLDYRGPHDFLVRLTEHARRHGWLSVWILSLDGSPVAAEYQLVYQGNVHALRADYDATHRNLSPGSYLNWKLLERLFASDATYYSMGPGENPYKDRWAVTYEQQYRIRFYGRSIRGKILRLIDVTLKPRLKLLLKRFSRTEKT